MSLRFVCVFGLLAMGAWTLGCGGGGAGSVAPPTPPPPPIQVTVTPQNGSVLLGETVNFAPSVSNSTNTSVSWSVNAISGGSAQVGWISADGVYTAPADLPEGRTVQVTATSNADVSKFATASLSVSSDVSVSLSSANQRVELGAIQPLRASISSQGHPDYAVRWSLSGTACPSACGSIDANGNYTAPQILPNPPLVTIVATSVADPAKSASLSLNIASDFTLQLVGPTTLRPGVTAAFVATFTLAPESKPPMLRSTGQSPAQVAAEPHVER